MINKVILIGYAAAPAELRTLESGVAMARLRMATSENIYNQTTGQSSQITQWHDIVMWRNTAQYAARFVEKGSQIYIEGRLRNRPVTVDGLEKQGLTTYEILADTLQILSKKPAAAVVPGAAPRAMPDSPTAAGQGAPQARATPSHDLPGSEQIFQSIAQIKDPDDIPF